MSKMKIAVAVAGVVLLSCVLSWAEMQGVAASQPAAHVPYSNLDIGSQKARLDQALQGRIAEIEKRFVEEAAFRRKMKDQRLNFEKKVVQEKKALLDSVQGMNPDQRRQAWQSFYRAQKEKRVQFKAKLSTESKKFWQERRMQQSRPASPAEIK